MSSMASQITGVSVVHSTVCSGADQRKHQISASLTFLRGIHRWPVNSPHKGSLTGKMFPFDDVIMKKVAVVFSNTFHQTWCQVLKRVGLFISIFTMVIHESLLCITNYFFFFFFFHKTLFHIIYIFWQCILTVSMSTSCCWYIIFTLSGQNTVSNKCHIVIQISIL